MCGDEDWDVIGQAAANRECGAGLTYNEQQRSFLLDFGGQQFHITDSALPADSKNTTDYKASIVRFQAVYLNTAEQTPPLDGGGPRGPSEEAPLSLLLAEQEELRLPAGTALVPLT
ncbi:hypothetical protein KUCAC02_035454, partial [Chaenocephalus aceratus]